MLARTCARLDLHVDRSTARPLDRSTAEAGAGSARSLVRLVQERCARSLAENVPALTVAGEPALPPACGALPSIEGSRSLCR
jgi:hypothetical protein